MANFDRFEDMDAWKLARELTNLVYTLTKKKSFSKDRGLKDPIRRASVSIMSNIAEGFERNSTKEFIQYLFTAKGSAGEVRSQLYVALDEGYISQSEFVETKELVNNIAGKLSNLIKYLESSK